MKYSTETKLINAISVAVMAGFAGTVILACLGVISYFMVG